MPPASAVPTVAWRPIGRNAYGEAVEENPTGHRRVATERGWEPETGLPSWRACRAKTNEDAVYAIQSLAAPWVSAGFEHNVRRAYVVYRLAMGEPFSSVPAHWGTDQDPRWKAFERGVNRARGERVLRAWLRRRPIAPDVPKWDLVLEAPSATASRGLQWGLAHRIEAWSKAHPEAVFWEMGLVDGADAATSRLSSGRRRAWSHRPGALWAPLSDVLEGWPAIPGSKGAFGGKVATAWPADVTPVFWATQAALQVHGEPGAWWAALAQRPRGVVVFSENPSHPAKALMAALRQAGRTPSRWRIPGHGEVWTWGWESQRYDLQLPIKEWAVPQEAPVGRDQDVGEDDRVPYRALSRVAEPEGMAGRALEANMHAALEDFSRQHDQGVDAWVAQGLGTVPEELGLRLGPEQVDAVALALQSLEAGAGFILSDETGFGKGRTLASLAVTGLRQGKTVVFITENPFLFSDFFRDLAAVSGGALPVPTLLHQNAHVQAPDGRTVARSLKSKVFKEMLKERAWEEGEDRLILTTYAQLSRAHDDHKVRFLKDRMGQDGWLLLDEAHNAAGEESSVGKRVEELTRAAQGTVYGSATYAKREANLGLYAPVLSLPPPARRLLRLALAGDDGRLREALTQQMARAGRLVRREHPPVPPPQPEWVALTDERLAAVQAFGMGWRYLFDAAAAFSRLRGVREALWLQLGAALSRSVKEFGLQLKADALIEFIAHKIEEDKKVVVVVDSTMEAALRDALTPVEEEGVWVEEEEAWEDDGAVEGAAAAPPQMIREGEGLPPLWRDRLRSILEAVCPRSAWESAASPEAEAARQAYQAAESAMLSLPEWDLAPLDRVRRHLDARSIPNSELSGRQTRLMLRPGGWNVVPRNDPDRNEVVRSYNSGQIDVLFVTRAGCAGISLHAGRSFKDQRVRCLVEWDIAANPVNRVQFWGRVRRKDQVIEPEFFGLVLDTPEDRRIMERENLKRRKMLAHMGASPAEQVGWLSELGESLVEEWAAERPTSAFRIGVSRPMPDNPIGRVDRALVRSLVLPAPEREGLLMRLDRGVALGAEAFMLSRQNRSQRPSRSIRRAWWWGDARVSMADPALALSSLRLDVVERIWRPEAGATSEQVAQAVRSAHGQQPTGQDVLSHWRTAWAGEGKLGVPTTLTRKRIADWAVQRLPKLSVGQALTFTHPSLERPVRAVVLGWDFPQEDINVHRASAWALSQVGLRVWAVGDAAPLVMPLSWLARDSAFQPLEKPAVPAWYDAPPVPFRGVAVEGHPVQAAAWGRRWGVGRSALVNDEDEGSQVVWLLPPACGWEHMMALPRDLVDTEHAFAFWREFPSETLEATLPRPQQFKAAPVEGGLRLTIDEATLKKAGETWLHVGLAKKIRFQPVRNEAGWLESTVAWKRVAGILHGLAAAGVGWRMPVRYLDWYRKTSPERTRAKA